MWHRMRFKIVLKTSHVMINLLACSSSFQTLFISSISADRIFPSSSVAVDGIRIYSSQKKALPMAGNQKAHKR